MALKRKVLSDASQNDTLYIAHDVDTYLRLL